MTDQSNGQRHVLSGDIDYLVFTAKDYILALSYFDILQILDSPHCTAVPNMPKYVRGVIDLMGEALPLIDTRTKLSLQSRPEEVVEFVDTFMVRKQNHLDWIAELKHAVDNDEKISVERDPHKCAFGQWYDTYKASTLALAGYMRQFDRPHKAIHRLADEAERLIEANQKDHVKSLIHAAENNELTRLINLFDGFEEKMRESYQEYAIVVIHDGQKYALAADTIKYFEKMDEIEDNSAFSFAMDERMVKGIGRRTVGEREENIIILDLASFLDFES